MVLFGGNVHDPVSPAARGFTSKNEKKVKKYLEKLKKYLTDHKVGQRVDSLIEDAPRLLTKEIKLHFEAIDRDMTRGMLYAEKQVKSKEFKYQWSVALDQAGYQNQYWKVRLLDIRNNSHSTIALAKLGARAGMKDDDNDFAWMEEKVKEKLGAAMKELKEIQKQDRQKQDESLQQ